MPPRRHGFPSCILWLRRTACCVPMMVACLTAALPAYALQWEEIGPKGGKVDQVLTSRKEPGVVYATTSNGTALGYVSYDGGIRWTERGIPFPCGFGFPNQIGDDDAIFAHCSNDVSGKFSGIMRSRDGMQTWSKFAPADGALAFDNASPGHAGVTGYGTTSDDGLTWSTFGTPPAVLTRANASDPIRGRLVSITTETPTVGPEYATNFYQSPDQGLSWSFVSTITTQMNYCVREINLSIDPTGRMAARLGCGGFQSYDGGVTWQAMVAAGLGAVGFIRVFPGQTEHWLSSVVMYVPAFNAVLVESRDAGVSWSRLPVPPHPVVAYDIDLSGSVWAATADGLYVLDTVSMTWTPRSDGINTHPVDSVFASARGTQRLVARDLDTYGYIQSLDDGRTWQPYSVAGKEAELIHSINVPGSVLATMHHQGDALYGSGDAGTTWRLLSQKTITPSGQIAFAAVPVGPQPGVVYGFHESCDANGFLGCSWNAHGVAKSLDGGVTWAEMDNGLPPDILISIVVSPVNAEVAYLLTRSSADPNVYNLYVTRDGALHWQATGRSHIRSVTVDPAEPGRVYLVDDTGGLWVSTDYAVTARAIGYPPVESKYFSLMVDPARSEVLYAIGQYFEVEMSWDRGVTWQRLVDASTTLRTLDYAFPQVMIPGLRAIYLGSAQGVLKLDLPIPEPTDVPTLSDWSMRLLALALSFVVATKLRDRTPPDRNAVGRIEAALPRRRAAPVD